MTFTRILATLNRHANQTTPKMNYQVNDQVIWMNNASRREGAVTKYTTGTVKGVYASGLLITWNLPTGAFSDLLSYPELGASGLYLPLLSDFSESQASLKEFQKTVKPLMLGACYPLKRSSKEFQVLPLVQNLDRHHQNRSR